MRALNTATANVRPLKGDEPQLVDWFRKAQESFPSLRFLESTPTVWMGLFDGDDLVTAYGANTTADGTIVVTAAVCEPSKRGATGLWLLGLMLKSMRNQHRIVFVVASENKRMRRIANTVLGARTIAEVKEL